MNASSVLHLLLYIALTFSITLQYIISDEVQPQVSVGLSVGVLNLTDGVKNTGLCGVLVQVKVLVDPGRERHGGKLGLFRSHLEIGREVRNEGELGIEAFGRLTS